MTQTAAAAGSISSAERGLEASEEVQPKKRDSPVALAMTFDELLGGSDETGETADDIVRTVRAWRDTPAGEGQR